MDFSDDIEYATECDKLRSAAAMCRGLKCYYDRAMRDAGRSDEDIQNSEYYKALNIALDLIGREAEVKEITPI